MVNAYLIAFGGLLLLAGRLGDLLGRRRVFLPGSALFTAASAAVRPGARDQLVLVVARFVQGIGGAMTSAVILGMIVTMFPEPREQAKAIGVFAFVASAGGAVGLLAGGVLTQSINWHWIFFINVPIGIATALLGPAAASPADAGTGLSAAAPTCRAPCWSPRPLMLGVYTIVKPGRRGRLVGRRTRWSSAPARRAAGRLRGPRGDGRQSADAAAHLPLAQRRRRQR